MPNVGPMELIIVLVIVLLIFGPKRLPSLGRQLGGGLREFKDSFTSKDDDRDAGEAPSRPALDRAQESPVEQHAAPSAAPTDAAPEQRA